ncbi:phosphatase 2C-like domain-containing protein [Pavlovales sp. CCMP2436]|nr:phosphatase 2C-like domain-containing protein [Pavlovales sp. CCMP2436]
MQRVRRMRARELALKRDGNLRLSTAKSLPSNSAVMAAAVAAAARANDSQPAHPVAPNNEDAGRADENPRAKQAGHGSGGSLARRIRSRTRQMAKLEGGGVASLAVPSSPTLRVPRTRLLRHSAGRIPDTVSSSMAQKLPQRSGSMFEPRNRELVANARDFQREASVPDKAADCSDFDNAVDDAAVASDSESGLGRIARRSRKSRLSRSTSTEILDAAVKMEDGDLELALDKQNDSFSVNARLAARQVEGGVQMKRREELRHQQHLLLGGGGLSEARSRPSVRWEVDCASHTGGLEYQEDFYDCNEEGLPGWLAAGVSSCYLGVYDGHSGVRAAEHCVETLCDAVGNLTKPPGEGSETPVNELARGVERALRDAYLQTDSSLVEMAVEELSRTPLSALEHLPGTLPSLPRASSRKGSRDTGVSVSFGGSASLSVPGGGGGVDSVGGDGGGGGGGGGGTEGESAAAEAQRRVVAAYESRRVKKEWLCGSTATSVVLAANLLVVAHVGDSIALLVRAGKPLELTAPHRPLAPQELERIVAAGGWVTGRLPQSGRVNGVLGVSRSFGDVEYKALKEAAWGQPFTAALVTAEPDVLSVVLTRDDECLVLASDGLWDALSYEEVATACSEWRAVHGGVTGLPEHLTRKAVERNVGDNVTVVVAGFTWSLPQ